MTTEEPEPVEPEDEDLSEPERVELDDFAVEDDDAEPWGS